MKNTTSVTQHHSFTGNNHLQWGFQSVLAECTSTSLQQGENFNHWRSAERRFVLSNSWRMLSYRIIHYIFEWEFSAGKNITNSACKCFSSLSKNRGISNKINKSNTKRMFINLCLFVPITSLCVLIENGSMERKKKLSKLFIVF